MGLCVVLAFGGIIGDGHTGDAADGRICVEIAARVGMDFVGEIGTTFASSPLGPVMQRTMGNGAAVGDYDDDGDLDVLLLGQRGQEDRLYRNDLMPGGSLAFTDVTRIAGVGDTALSRVAQFADLDGDGLLDLVVINDTDPADPAEPSRLYRNQGDGTFADVTDGSGFHPAGYIVGGLSLADPDTDGDLDIYISYWTEQLGGDPALRDAKGAYPATNAFYRNDGAFRFTDISLESGLGGVNLDAFSSLFADFDGDRDLDLFVAMDHREDLYYEQFEPMRWRNRWSDVGATHKGNDMGLAIADLGSDGELDVFATNITDPEGKLGTGGGNVLVTFERSAEGTRIVDHPAAAVVEDTGWGWGTVFLDIDLDGALDLYAVQGMDEFVGDLSPTVRDGRSRLFLGSRRGFSPSKGTGCEIPGDQRAVVAFDADRDGDLDLLVTQVGLPVRLLRNETPKGRSVTVDLGAGGAAAPGSRVTVEVDGRRVTQVVGAGGSYLAGPPMEAVFGLGKAKQADLVEVVWADGRTTRLTDVPSGSIVRPAP